MMLIDMTTQLMPILYGFNVLLVVSATALMSGTVVSSWFRSKRFERPRLVLHRPVLAR